MLYLQYPKIASRGGLPAPTKPSTGRLLMKQYSISTNSVFANTF